MRYGRLDRRITIQEKLPTFPSSSDSWGTESVGWADSIVCWGQKKDESSVEGTELQQLVNTTRTVWRVRYNAAITTQMRIKYEETIDASTVTTYYYITGLKEIGRRAALDLITELRK